MKFKEYLERINNIGTTYPDSLEYEVIYSHDDEGNEYQKVNNLPCLMEIININDNRFLEQLYDNDDEPGLNINAVMIN